MKDYIFEPIVNYCMLMYFLSINPSCSLPDPEQNLAILVKRLYIIRTTVPVRTWHFNLFIYKIMYVTIISTPHVPMFFWTRRNFRDIDLNLSIFLQFPHPYLATKFKICFYLTFS